MFRNFLKLTPQHLLIPKISPSLNSQANIFQKFLKLKIISTFDLYGGGESTHCIWGRVIIGRKNIEPLKGIKDS